MRDRCIVLTGPPVDASVLVLPAGGLSLADVPARALQALEADG